MDPMAEFKCKNEGCNNTCTISDHPRTIGWRQFTFHTEGRIAERIGCRLFICNSCYEKILEKIRKILNDPLQPYLLDNKEYNEVLEKHNTRIRNIAPSKEVYNDLDVTNNLKITKKG